MSHACVNITSEAIGKTHLWFNQEISGPETESTMPCCCSYSLEQCGLVNSCYNLQMQNATDLRYVVSEKPLSPVFAVF